MNEFEWKTRCKMQFARRTNDFNYDWQEQADACYECYFDGNDGYFDDEPELAADDEMSYWD